MLPLAKTLVTGLSSLGAGLIASSLFQPFYKNANGLTKIVLWFGGAGLGIAAGNIVQREVAKQYDAVIDAF